MVLAEDDHLRAGLLRRLDDRAAGDSGLPGQVRLSPAEASRSLASVRCATTSGGGGSALPSSAEMSPSVPKFRGTSGSSGMFATLRTVIRPRDSCASAIARSRARLPPSYLS